MAMKPSSGGSRTCQYSRRNGPSASNRDGWASSRKRGWGMRGSCVTPGNRCAHPGAWRLKVGLGRDAELTGVGADRVGAHLHRLVEDAEQLLLVEHHFLAAHPGK